jgi:hypothetical protein
MCLQGVDEHNSKWIWAMLWPMDEPTMQYEYICKKVQSDMVFSGFTRFLAR